MDYHSCASYTTAEKQQLHQRQYENDLVYEQRHDDKAVYLPYLMNKAALNAMRACFVHRRVYVSNKAEHRPSHPIPAAHLWYARNNLVNELANVNRVIDLGGNLLDTLHRDVTDHACTMSTSAHDRSRYLTKLYSADHATPRNDAISHDAVRDIWAHALSSMHVVTSPKFCLSGAQNCKHQAEVMISIHSIYDMSIDDVVRMFMAHGAHTLIVWAFFPPELFSELHGSADVRSMSGHMDWYTCTVKGEDVTMRFRDASFYYQHKIKTWSSWLRYNRIRAPEFDLVIECQEQHGIMFKLRITRIPSTIYSPLAHEICYPFLCDYVRIPDVYHYVETHDHNVRYTVCPKLFANRIFNQALKAPEINANSIHTLAASCITRIDVSDVVINKFVDICAMDLDSVVYSIVLIASAHRMRRSRNFKWFIDMFTKDLHASQSILDKAVLKLTRCAEALSSYFRGTYSPSGSYDLAVLPFSPIDCQEFITSGVFYEGGDDYLPNTLRGFALGAEHPPVPVEQISVDANAPIITVFPDDTLLNIPPVPIHHNVIVSHQYNDTTYVIPASTDIISCTTPIDAVIPCAAVVSHQSGELSVCTASARATGLIVEDVCVDLPLVLYRAPNPITTLRLPEPVCVRPSVQLQPDADVHMYVRHADAQFVEPPSFIPYPTFTGDVSLAALDKATYDLSQSLLPSRMGRSTRAVRKLMPLVQHFVTDDAIELHDIGAGPGAFGAAFRKCYPRSTIIGLTYGIPITPINLPSYDVATTKDVNTVDFTALARDCSTRRKIIVCDIGGRPIWHDTVRAVHRYVCALADPTTVYIIKCFTPNSADRRDSDYVLHLISRSLSFALHRSTYSGEQNHEFYFVGRGVCAFYRSINDLHTFQSFYNNVEFRRRSVVTTMARRYVYNTYSTIHELRFVDERYTLTSAVMDTFWAAFHREAPLHLKPLLKRPACLVTSLNARVLAAAPAAGKSAYMRDSVKGSKLFVVPTCKLRDEYTKRKFRAVTFHAVFLQARTCDHLILDEAYTFRLPYLLLLASHVKFRHFWVLGDPYQIGAIDFTDDAAFATFPRVPFPTHFNTHSLGMPQDVTSLCSGLGYPQLATSSSVHASINFYDVGYEAFPQIIARLTGRTSLVVYNQDTVDHLKLSNIDASTIHEMQGGRPENVVFYYDQAAIDTNLSHSVEHLRVLITRHTDKLVFIGQIHHMRKLIDYYGSNISINLDRYQLHLRDVDIHTDTLSLNGSYNAEHMRLLKYRDAPDFGMADVDQVIDILSHVLPAATEGTANFATFIQTTIPYHGSGHMIIKLERVIEKMRSTSVPGWMVSQSSFALRHFPTSMAVLKCLGDRYTKVTPDNCDLSQAVVDMFNGFSKVLGDFDVNHYPALETDDEFANSIIARMNSKTYAAMCHLKQLASIEGMFEHHLVEYFRALDEKVLPRDQYDIELTEARSFWLRFFPKRQVKPKIADDWETSDKAPQGIGAFEKNVNMMFAAYGRMLSQFLDQILLPHVIFASNHSEEELSARISAAYSRHHADRLLNLERAATDFSEFDSTQSRPAFAFMSVLYAVLGMPTFVLHRYRTNCQRWVMTDDAVRLHGVLKMHSGSFETLIRNSLIGLVNNCVIYIWDDVVLILFKGDDFELEGFGVHFMPGSWLKDHGLSIKFESPPVGEFAGSFVLPAGTTPDVVRRCVKYTTTMYRGVHHHAEAVKSLISEFNCITNQAHLEAAIIATQKFYSRPGLNLKRPPTAADIRVMFDFLHTQAFATKHNLFRVTLPIMHVSTAAGTSAV
jgi:hypothetical protein